MSILCIFMFRVRYHFRIQTMFGSSLTRVVCLFGPLSYLHYLCLLAYSGVQNHVFMFCLSSSCVPYVASFSELHRRYSPTFIYIEMFYFVITTRFLDGCSVSHLAPNNAMLNLCINN